MSNEMSPARAGWYQRRRVGSKGFNARFHFFRLVENYTDTFGRRLSLAAGPSACSRVGPGTGLSFETANPDHPANCAACRKAVGRA